MRHRGIGPATLGGVLGFLTLSSLVLASGPMASLVPPLPSSSTLPATAAGVGSGGVPAAHPASYAVTFTEEGLPSGVHWSVALAGATQDSSGPPIEFSEPNGTYPFVVNGPQPYGATPAAGTLTVAGSGVQQVVTFTTASEGVVASVPVGSQPGFAAYDPADGLVYVPNTGADTTTVLSGTTVVGTVLVGALPSSGIYDPRNGFVYVQDFGSGIVSILNGTSVVGKVPVGSDPQYATFDPANGYVYVSNYGSDSVTVLNGTHLLGTAVTGQGPTAAACDAASGLVYVPNYGSSTVTILNATSVVATLVVGTLPDSAVYDPGNGYVYVTNLDMDSVTILSGTSIVGTVSVQGAPYSATYDPADGLVYVTNYGSGTVSLLQGTEVVGTVRVGAGPEFATYDSGNGYVYVTNSGSATVTMVNGTNVVATVPVGELPSSGVYDAGNGYLYETNSGSDNVSVFASRAAYPVTFTERGLPPGTPWEVSLDGAPERSVNPVLAFTEPNGTASYAIHDVPGWHQTNLSYRGSISVAGSAVRVTALQFVPVTYTVTFRQEGLGSGSWGVTFDGRTARAPVGSEVRFDGVANGTYGYNVSAFAGYTIQARHGDLVVAGPPGTITLRFSQVTYAVSFAAAGLPNGTNWVVELDGVRQNSTRTAIAYHEPNGTYSYTLLDVSGWHQSTIPYAGWLTVNGSLRSEPTLEFFEVTYPLVAVESGLPLGTGWYLNLSDGRTIRSTTSNLSFSEPNGTQQFSFGTAAHYIAIGVRNLTVNGDPLPVRFSISFVPTFGITFERPSGAAAGTPWTVYVNATRGTGTGVPPSLRFLQTATTSSVLVYVPNGSYDYSIVVSGNPTLMTQGTVTMAGSPIVANPSASASTFLGFSGLKGFYILAAGVVTVVAMAVLVVVMRRKPPASAPPAT